MKKLIFGIFAHPDDEAFGPAGTLLLETKSGSELHLVTLTAGEAGVNPDGHADLGAVRLDEWRQCSKLLGASSTTHLGYTDGTLSNGDLIAIANSVEKIVKEKIASCEQETKVEFICFDLNGISGHIDHIVASRAACLAFYRLKEASLPVGRLRLYCLSRDRAETENIDWLYMEPGHENEEIDETVDATALQAELVDIVRCHHTQRSDGEKHLKQCGDTLGIDHFLVKS